MPAAGAGGQPCGEGGADEATRGCSLPEVIEVHYTTGDADLLAHVVAKDTTDLHRITKAILAIDGVDRTSTAISLGEVIPYRPRSLLGRLASG
ncbi:Lrp/AsnC ligand binding domain-containing protein [Streptomyces sp. NPDC058470]|uniref:Lrp/AsnC ligand binding domain-containing protein n=1 Tax=Streptomyces sp. NPDC058470 TaxID=3346515 RepID=UPI00364CD0D3